MITKTNVNFRNDNTKKPQSPEYFSFMGSVICGKNEKPIFKSNYSMSFFALKKRLK